MHKTLKLHAEVEGRILKASFFSKIEISSLAKKCYVRVMNTIVEVIIRV